MTQDTPPKLPRCSSHLDTLAEVTRNEPQFEHLLDELKHAPVDMQYLSVTLRRARALTGFINDSSSQPGFWKAEDDLSSLQALGPLTHDLLKMPRADHPSPNGFEIVREMTRLALLVLLSGLKARYGFSAVEMSTLQHKFIGLVRYTIMGHGDLPFQRLQLWALVTTAMLQPVDRDRSLLVQEIFSRMIFLNLTDGQSVVNTVRDIIWMEVVAQDNIESLIYDIDTLYSGYL